MKNKTKLPNIFLGIVLIFLFLPIAIVVIYSFNSNNTVGIWESFSFQWYQKLFTNRAMKRALVNSIVLALSSSITAAVIGTLGATGMAKADFRGKKGIEYISMLPIMIPEIVLGMVFLAYFSLLNISFGMGTLFIAHTSFGIPYIYNNVKARLIGMDPSLVEAARDLGASEGRAFLTITLPSITPAILSGMLLAFAMSMDDVIISIFLTSARVNTLPIMVYTQLKTESTPEINALCTLMLVATLFIMLAATIIKKIGIKNTKTS